MSVPMENKLARAWPVIIDLWIAAVLATFLVVRVVSSATGKHLLKFLGIT